MLLAVADVRGVHAAAMRFEHAVSRLGPPGRRVSAASAVLGNWGLGGFQNDDDHLGANDPIVIDGSIIDRQPPGTESILERAVRARGDFALLAADADGVVLACGGAGGYRPLYLHAFDGGLVASTSLDLLTRIIPEAPAIDPDGLAGFAAATSPLVRDAASLVTLFRGVVRVPMYEAWHVSPSGRTLRRATFVPLRDGGSVGGREPVDALRDALTAAVARALRGHERAGLLVSGGVDSSALLAVGHDVLRREARRRALDAFAWSYETYYGDDRPYLQSLTAHVGIDPVRVTASDAGRFVGKTFIQDRMPLCGPGSNFLAATAERARALGVTVLLSGSGGDEVVDGDPGLLSQLVRAGHPVRALAAALRLRGPCMGGPSWRFRRYIVRPLLREMVPRPVRRWRLRDHLRRRYPWAGTRLRRYFADLASSASQPEPQLEWTAAERFEHLARLPGIRKFCVNRSQEESLMGCVRREPYFDEDFLRVVAALPPLALMQGNFRRGLLRNAMRGLVPENVRTRETKSMMEPALAAAVAAAGGFQVLHSLSNVNALADWGIVEPRPFREAFEELARAPDRGAWILIWPVLAAEAFMRHEQGRP